MAAETLWDRYRRTGEDRVVAGVAGGVGRALGVDPAYVRSAFVVLAVCLGIGALLYLGLWLARLDQVDDLADAPQLSPAQAVGLAAAYFGALLILRELSVWPGDPFMWPLILVAFGVAVVWQRSDGRLRGALPGFENERPNVWQVLGGAVLTVAGVSLALSQAGVLANAGALVFGAAITVLGLGLVLGPWIVRLVRDLGSERRDRIRATERAELAAHLHDSVLQTLAMIQRSEDPRRMATLARGQERELRSWLYGQTPTADGTLLSTALEVLGATVDSEYEIRVDVVTVGDVELSAAYEALVAAAGEAMKNAASHSESHELSVYMEVDDAVDVWISDQGKGFDPTVVPPDRLGISESIIGRMKRNGGESTITSEPGEGTEVHLHMPLDES